MRKILLILLVIVRPLINSAQIITTYAGNGINGHTGDGGVADTATIGHPYGCACDSHGNLYFCTTGGSGVGGNWIRKVTPCGIISSVVGTGVGGYNGDNIPATSAEINNPTGIAFDTSNNMYIADAFNNRVRKVDAGTGLITTIAGTGSAGFGGDGGPATAALLNEPSFICFDKFGNLYIIDQSNYRIRKINASNIISTYAGNGTPGYAGDGGPADSAEISDNYGICTDTIGNVFSGQDYWFRLRKVNTADTITTIAGNGLSGPSGDGGLADTAGIEFFGLADDRFGNLFISGWHENDIRKINGSGIIYTVAGNGIAGFSGDGGLADSAEIDVPYGITIDLFGNLYIADNGNSRIRKVTFNPVITPTINITYTADTVCSGTSVTFTATVTGGSTSFTYQWLVNGSATGTASSYTYNPANGDSIRCVLSVNGLCIMPSSNTIYMVVTPATVPTITLTSSASAVIGSIVTVNATISGAGSSYDINWYDNGVLFNSTTIPTVAYTKAAGTDNITATVIPSLIGMLPGCYDSSTSAGVIITVSDAGIATSPGLSKGVSIFPNPASTELTIVGQNIVNVNVSNLLGQMLITEDCNCNKVNINIATLPPGVYAVKVTDSEGGKTIIKIVKE